MNVLDYLLRVIFSISKKEKYLNIIFWRIFGAQKFGSKVGYRLWLGALPSCLIVLTLCLTDFSVSVECCVASLV